MAENNKSMDKGKKTTDRFYYCTAPAYRRRLLFWSLLFYRAFSSRLTGEWF